MCINIDGDKDVLGYWIAETESAKQWVSVLNDLKTRGLEDIFILSCDNLSGISEAVKSVYPKNQIQKCIIHQIRNSVKHVNYKDLKEFTIDMKKIYEAKSLEHAENFLQIFENKWKDKYGYATKSWRKNFDELVTFFNFPFEIRKLIYTTNLIENLNRNIRKFTKNKGSFPTEDSLSKIVYFPIKEQTKKWTIKVGNWRTILNQLTIILKIGFNI